eukprot:101944-Amphidinium_carterae.1
MSSCRLRGTAAAEWPRDTTARGHKSSGATLPAIMFASMILGSFQVRKPQLSSQVFRTPATDTASQGEPKHVKGERFAAVATSQNQKKRPKESHTKEFAQHRKS